MFLMHTDVSYRRLWFGDRNWSGPLVLDDSNVFLLVVVGAERVCQLTSSHENGTLLGLRGSWRRLALDITSFIEISAKSRFHRRLTSLWGSDYSIGSSIRRVHLGNRRHREPTYLFSRRMFFGKFLLRRWQDFSKDALGACEYYVFDVLNARRRFVFVELLVRMIRVQAKVQLILQRIEARVIFLVVERIRSARTSSDLAYYIFS